MGPLDISKVPIGWAVFKKLIRKAKGKTTLLYKDTAPNTYYQIHNPLTKLPFFFFTTIVYVISTDFLKESPESNIMCLK